jgi:hypothetical protein
MMKNNIIAFGLTLLCVGLAILGGSVLYHFGIIREILLVMGIMASFVWMFLSIRDIVKNLR